MLQKVSISKNAVLLNFLFNTKTWNRYTHIHTHNVFHNSFQMIRSNPIQNWMFWRTKKTGHLLSSWGGSRPVSWRHTCSECWVDWKREDTVTGASVTLISTTKKPYSHRERERIHCRSCTRLTSVCLSTCRYRFQETQTICVLIGQWKEWPDSLADAGSNLFQDMAMNEWDSGGTAEGKTEG